VLAVVAGCVARNFLWLGKQPSVNLLPLAFKTSSSGVSSWTIVFRLPANEKTAFHELASIKSFVSEVLNFYLINATIYLQNVAAQVLVEISMICSTLCNVHFSANIAIEQEDTSLTPSRWRVLYLHESYGHQHIFNRNRVASLLYETDFRSKPSTKLSCL